MSSFKKRSFPREKVYASVQVISESPAKLQAKEYCYTKARMLNSDTGGMYIESPFKIEPESNICIRLTDTFFSHDYADEACRVHYARVKWCKPLVRQTDPCFGIGIQIFNTVVQADVKTNEM